MHLVLCFLFAVTPAERGPTTLRETSTCCRVELAGETRTQWLRHPGLTRPVPPRCDDSLWVLVDSIHITGELAPDRRLALTYSESACSLELLLPLDTLPTACRYAIAESPDWLAEELTSAFRRLGDSAVFYADIILGAPPCQVDEVAFCVATIGPEVLTHPLFNPDLLYANSQQLYMVDDSLRYADIVDRGDPPGDYWSTLRLRVLDAGDTVEVELPRDIYYYYVVHPTTSDELPRLDDYVLDKHWREYFFYEADSGFPVLCDYIKQAEVVWARQLERYPSGRPFEADDYALDVIGNWVDRTITGGATGNRPIHPNVICHEHNGNCGEIQDMLTAACRTCLIPAVNCSDPCEDHVWNEFWDGQWYPYALDRTTRIADSACGYEELHGGSKRISAVFNWRPDGYWWTVTGEYSLTCSLYVRVLDLRGLPVDAARVLVYTEGWVGGLDVATIGFTDSEGAVGFELGDLRNYYLRVSSPLGDYPSPDSSIQVVRLSQTGARYYKTVCLPAAIPAPRASPLPPPGDTFAWFLMELDLSSITELDAGYSIARGAGTGDPDDSVRFYRYYADQQTDGTADLFGLDSTGYAAYLAGEHFDAMAVWDDAFGPTARFPCWWLHAGHHLVLSSEDKLHLSRWLEADALLYGSLPGIAGGEAPEPRATALPTFFRDRLRLDLGPDARPARLRVFDVTGRAVGEHDIGPPGFRVDIPLEAGVYLLRIEDERGTRVGKAIVSH